MKPNVAKEGDENALDLSTNKSVRKTSSTDDVHRFTHSDDLRKLMEVPWGRRLVWGWLNDSGIFKTTVGGSVEQTYYNIGLQEWGRFMWQELHTPELLGYFRMMQDEAIDAESMAKSSI